MGGRGSTSGISGGAGGISVSRNGETTDFYFTRRGSQNYYQRGIDGQPEPTPNNITAKEFQQRVLSNGAKAQLISGAEKKRREAEYKKDRKKTNEFLNTMDAQTGGDRKGHRLAAVSRRASRRRK